MSHIITIDREVPTPSVVASNTVVSDYGVTSTAPADDITLASNI